jgi:hypothetical protein
LATDWGEREREKKQTMRREEKRFKYDRYHNVQPN